MNLNDTIKNNALERAKPNLTAENLRTSRNVLKSPDISQLIGLISHLAYWNVFGHFNRLPLDVYHRKQLFISLASIKMDLEKGESHTKFFNVFLMPFLILAVRIEVELIFKN
jgi:hypothetical protein